MERSKQKGKRWFIKEGEQTRTTPLSTRSQM